MRGLDFSPIRFRYVLTLMLMVVLAVTSMVFGEILEVETMAVKTTGHQITDGWLLESEGYVSDSVDFVSSGFYEFTVRAKGHHGDDGWPFLELRVDDVVVGPILVTHTSWHNYSILSEVSSGRHQLTLAYINDSGVRSLSLDRVEILSTTVDEEVWLINLSESILSRFPDPTDYSITSWQVEELMYGMSQSYEVTGDLDYLNYVRSFMDGHVNSNGDLDIEIRDFIPGIILIWLYQATGEQKYLGAAEQVGEYLLTEYPRTSEGGFVHLPRLLDQLWVDTLGGLGRFLGLMGYITGDIRYFNEGVHQILIHASHLQDQVSGLFYHGWDEDGSADWAVTAWNTSAYFWARGNGWVIRGIADFLEYLPESHPQRDAVVAIFTSLADGLLQYQDQSSGLWYTVLDHGDDGGNYLESSGSALFAYGLQKGINIGVLDQSYQDAVHQANNGLYRKFYVQEEVEAIVTGISAGTGPGDYENYVNKPIGTGNEYYYGDGVLLQQKSTLLRNNLPSLEIFGIDVTQMTDSSVVVVWVTNKLSNSYVEYGLDANYGDTTVVDSNFVFTHNVIINGLQDETMYHFRAVSEAKNGERAYSQDMTFMTEKAPNLSFTNISLTSGITRPYGSELTGGHGCAFADVDNDGLPDLYITLLFTYPTADLFFHNVGRNEFKEEAQIRGVDDFDGGSHGVCFADFDNDGDYDIFNGASFNLEGMGEHNNIYENNGYGFFSDVTEKSELVHYKFPTRGVLAFDMEGDGDLDLFCVSNYLGSDDPIGETNEVYRNDGNFNFTSVQAGNLRSAPAGQGATAADYDLDGDVDIFAGNRTGPLNVLQNDGTGHFSLIPPDSIGIMHPGREGVTFGDIDNDGDLDLLLVGDVTGVFAYLYKNNGDGTFTFHHTFENIKGYMGGFADVDNDGDLDLIFAGDDKCYLNDGSGNFFETVPIPVNGINDPRAISLADIDDDGDLDFAVACKRSHSLLIRNNLKSGNWLKIKLYNSYGQAGAYGAKTYIYPPGQSGENIIGMRESRSNNGYLGQNDPILHFGLGELEFVDVLVVFQDGGREIRSNISANQTITIISNGENPEEFITKPTVSFGPDSGYINESYEFVAEGAVSNLGHELEYQFDWGYDKISEWGFSSRIYTYFTNGVYQVKVRARCKIHNEVVSDWSDIFFVTIQGYSLFVDVTPAEAGSVAVNPDKNEYANGDTVNLSAIAQPHFIFRNWDGDLIGDENPTILIFDSHKNVRANFVAIDETITPPDKPLCPDTLILGKQTMISTGNSVSSMGHPVEYQFSWGDNNLSDWGNDSVFYAFDTTGQYQIKARGRCKLHPDIISDWSVAKDIFVRGLDLYIEILPNNSAGEITTVPEKMFYACNDTVQLTPFSIAEFFFEHWEGDLSGSNYPVTIKMDDDKYIIAHFNPIDEVINTPDNPFGPDSGYRRQLLTFKVNHTESNLNHPLEYQFDWGDSTFSDWGDTVRSKFYETSSVYSIKARARCKIHQDIMSDWSSECELKINGCNVTINIEPENAGLVDVIPEKEDYDFGEEIVLIASANQGYEFCNWNSVDEDTNLTKQVTVHGDTAIHVNFEPATGLISNPGVTPGSFQLFQNYPNPFNMETTIKYQIANDSFVRLDIYNIEGRLIKKLVNKFRTTGAYRISWDSTDRNNMLVPCGVYFYSLTTGGYKFIKKMILIK